MHASSQGRLRGVIAAFGRSFRRKPVELVPGLPANDRRGGLLLDLSYGGPDSYEPYRDYRPSGRSGDPSRPW